MQNPVDEKGGIGILLVEDEETARASLSRMLSLKFPGIRLYLAENGRSGLDLYRQHLPELVITDINMPQMNGIEMAGAIREVAPKAQIIVLTAHSETRFRLDAEELGIDHYVLKPVDRHELFAVVGQCLEQIAPVAL
jgi:YesN/AraC family two-component response regulator